MEIRCNRPVLSVPPPCQNPKKNLYFTIIKLFILSGKKNSGKTTWCYHHLVRNRRQTVHGVLQVKVYQGEECIGYDACCLPAEISIPFARQKKKPPENWDGLQEAGRFSISGSGIKQVDQYLLQIRENTPRYIIIDELGRLEAGGKGLFEPVQRILRSPEPALKSLFLVIQQQVLSQLIDKYQLQKYKFINLDKIIPRW